MWRGTSDHDLKRLLAGSATAVAPPSQAMQNFARWIDGELAKLEVRFQPHPTFERTEWQSRRRARPK